MQCFISRTNWGCGDNSLNQLPNWLNSAKPLESTIAGLHPSKTTRVLEPRDRYDLPVQPSESSRKTHRRPFPRLTNVSAADPSLYAVRSTRTLHGHQATDNPGQDGPGQTIVRRSRRIRTDPCQPRRHGSSATPPRPWGIHRHAERTCQNPSRDVRNAGRQAGHPSAQQPHPAKHRLMRRACLDVSQVPASGRPPCCLRHRSH